MTRRCFVVNFCGTGCSLSDSRVKCGKLYPAEIDQLSTVTTEYGEVLSVVPEVDYVVEIDDDSSQVCD